MKKFVEKLIERLEEERNYNEKMMLDSPDHFRQSFYGTRMNTYGKAIEIVNQLAEEYNQGWIPCSERLPGSKIDVLVWKDNMYSVAWYQEGTKHWFSNDFPANESKDVIAWQPLPSPYKLTEQNQQTRYERIHSMSVEELADKILASDICSNIDSCQEFPKCQNLIEKGEEIPDEMCKKCLIQWLNSPEKKECEK